MKTVNQIRQTFLDYFAQKDHQIVPSSSLVPLDDPTLLFTNAGMVQFKDSFLGKDNRGYQRATSSQRCVRAGGKHNDLENVGYTARHHTFFEMLGNFSFGDYFKREAIAYAWEFLTGVLGLPPERLWVTVYQDDDEAADIWLKELKVDPERFSRCGEKDNFWAMGDTGPCGPCSEIFYDHGPDVAGGPPGSPDEEGERYVEIWNLVFMQYNRDANGELHSLPKPSVDTGMGLERIAAVVQGVHSNYDIDLFKNIIQAVADITQTRELDNSSLRVIADHIRACVFLILDGVTPSNEGRGYVLRRIIRRAIRHGHQLGVVDPFFSKLVAVLVKEMGEAYPELAQSQALCEEVLQTEEQQFAKTLEQGMGILEDALRDLKGKQIPGHVVFRLYDTYGFPVDLTADIARERDLTLDMPGFEKEMEQQRARARASSHFYDQKALALDEKLSTDFVGYDHLRVETSAPALFRDGVEVDTLAEGDDAVIVLEKTPFYAESGGQVGDQGEIHLLDHGLFVVRDTQKQAGVHLHIGTLKKGQLQQGATVTAEVDPRTRQATRLNHSATHLLHAALRHVLGEGVIQKGSLVDAQRLRFDFSHPKALSTEQLHDIESLVNAQIRLNSAVVTDIMTPEEATKKGALALFGEKYADQVRVLNMGDFSMELCGGTHVDRTGDIGLLKISTEEAVAAGIRRIEAVTGQVALDWVLNAESQIKQLSGALNCKRDEVEAKVTQLQQRQRDLEKAQTKLQSKLAQFAIQDLLLAAQETDGAKLLLQEITADAKTLREMVPKLVDKLGTAIVVLAAVNDGKVSVVVGVSKGLTAQIKAGDLVNFVATQVGGKGGGRPDIAQAGGNQPEHLEAALASLPAWISENKKHQ